jgi:hypothetical protein
VQGDLEFAAGNLIGGIGVETIVRAAYEFAVCATAERLPLVQGRYVGALYTGETRALRPYRCASCGTIQHVGCGALWTTVDVLRGDGCPECGAAKFRPLPLARQEAVAATAGNAVFQRRERRDTNPRPPA